MGHGIDFGGGEDTAVGYRAPKPRSTAWRFGGGFLFFLVIAGLWGWGVDQFMRDIDKDFVPKRTFTWGDTVLLLSCLYIVPWLMLTIWYQLNRLALLGDVLAEYEALITFIFNTATDNTKLATVLYDRTLAGGGPGLSVGTIAAVHELVGMVLLSMTLLVWQVSSPKPKYSEAYGIANAMQKSGYWYTGKIPASMQSYVAATSETYASVAITGMAMMRAQAMYSPEASRTMLMDIGGIQTRIDSVNKAVARLMRSHDALVWPYLLIAVYILCVAFLIAAPFIMRIGQGSTMVYTYPVVFLCVGGMLGYTWFLGDVFMHPTDTHFDCYYGAITRLINKSNVALANKFQGGVPQGHRYSTFVQIFSHSSQNKAD